MRFIGSRRVWFAVILAALFGVTLVFLDRERDQAFKNLSFKVAANGYFFSQMQFELMRLSRDLTDFSDEKISFNDVTVRYEIVWSRAKILEDSFMGQHEAVQLGLANWENFANKNEETIYSLQDHGGQSALILRDELDILAKNFHIIWVNNYASSGFRNLLFDPKLSSNFYQYSLALIGFLTAVYLGIEATISRKIAVRENLARERASEAEKNLRRIIDSMTNALLIVESATGNILDANDASSEILGYSRAEVLATNIDDIIPPKTRILLLEPSSNLGHPIKSSHAVQILTKSESMISVQIDTSPLLVLGENCLLMLFHDLSEKEENEMRLRRAQRLEAIGKLTGGVAHDFNNLLAVIQGCAEFLEEMPGHDQKLVEQILHATGRGADLTHRLLAYARQQPLSAKAIDISVFVVGLRDMLVRTLGETVRIETILPADLWTAHADPGQVEDALLNLAINARDAMPDGGTLVIECLNSRIDEQYVRQNSEAVSGDYVVLSVTDTGTGMNADVQAQIFEPFFTTKDVGEGSGLGLSMVYGFAKQSGGHVSAYSEEGKGTTIKVYLPRDDDKLVLSATAETGSVPAGQGQLILVIEDNDLVRNLALLTLTSLGYRPRAVTDAREARAWINAGNSFDLILSDVVLPGGTSGPEFAEEVRADRPDVKIVFMSGYPAESAKQNGFIGSDSVLLNKPFRKDQLAKVLSDAFDDVQSAI